MSSVVEMLAVVARLASRHHDLDSLDHVAFEHLIDDLDAVEHLREDGVLVIEARVVDQVDEDLRVAGVAAARVEMPTAPRTCGQRPTSSRMKRGVADILVRAGAAALDDEVRDDAVEREAVVVARLREVREAEDRRPAPAR